VLAIALANKLARIAWAVLNKGLLRDNLDENGGGSRGVKRRPVAKR
jgi:hypothetical protein